MRHDLAKLKGILMLRTGQFIDSSTPNTCYCRLQRQLPRFSRRKIDANRNQIVYKQLRKVVSGNILHHTQGSTVIKLVLLYFIENWLRIISKNDAVK